MNLVFEPAWPWPIIAAIAAALWVMVALTYPRRIRHLPRGIRWFLLGTRYAVTLLLLFTLLRPAIEYSTSDKKDAVILVLSDVSRSMSTPDGPASQTRFQFMKKTLNENEESLKQLSDDLEVRQLTFDQAAQPAETLPQKPEGDQTALGNVLKSVPTLAGGKRVAAVFLLSDGAQRVLPPNDADPRTEARVLGQQQSPVYTVPFGSSGLSENAVDLAVEDLLVDTLAFEKKLVPMTFKVRALGAANKQVQVRILVENRSGVKVGSSGELEVPAATSQSRTAQQIDVKTVSEVIPVELSFVPDQVGEFKIAVEVVPLDGELKLPNNRIETILTVQKGGINVAYFDTPRPEQRWVRRLNTSEKIQVDFNPVKWTPEMLSPVVKPEFFEPGKYDVYLIGDVPAAAFGSDMLQQLAARVDEGAGLMMIGGVNSFGAGGYASSPLADLLPVAMRVTDRQDGVTISSDLNITGDQVMLPTERGLDHYIMRLDSSDNRGSWAALPPLMGVNKLRPKSDAVEVLAQTDQNVPLLLAQEVGKARVLAFAGDTTYVWALAGFETLHQRFWRQVIFWLAHKEYEGDQPVWVRADPRVNRMGGGIELTMGARNEDGTPMPEAQFEVEVIHPDGESNKPTPQRTSQSHRVDFRSTQTPGDYWVRVSAKKGDANIGPDAYTRFIVKEQDLELDNPSANPTLLNEIAALSGGTSIPPENLADFIAEKRAQGGWNPEMIQRLRIPLYDNWWVIGLFVGLLSSEWLVRKLRGLV